MLTLDFMDALCDPRAFLSAQEKRAEQLKALGIEETDISKDVIQSKGTGAGGTTFLKRSGLIINSSLALRSSLGRLC